MMNPLIKRLPREFKSDLGKYIVISLFMIMLISLVSGFLVGDDSLTVAYEEGFTKYNVEHGHMSFDKELPDELIAEIEKNGDIRLTDLRYFDEEMSNTGKTLRVYKERGAVNMECLMSGVMPTAADEIAIDRVFAMNADLEVGDTLTLKGKELTICGIVALPDYSALYKSNTDMMLDSINFGVGVMTDEGYEAVGSTHMMYNYAWQYNFEYDKDDKVRANELSEELIKTLEDVLTKYDEAIVEEQVGMLTDKMEQAGKEYAEYFMNNGKAPEKNDLSVELSDFMFGVVRDSVTAQMNGEEFEMPEESAFKDEIDRTDIIAVNDYVPQYLNNAIMFAGTDMGTDKASFILFNYIVVAILAFIFAVTTSNTIASEAGVIGTLRASGYSRGELIRHYLVLPVAVTLIASVIGNILGYTVLRVYMSDMYYNTFSLPTYEVLWNAEAFMLTTVVPCIMMLVINFFVIGTKMRLSPLQFLRRELKKKPRKKALKLNTKIPFITRFRLRIILQNIPSYIVMICGIILGAVVIVFGELFTTMFDDYAAMMNDSIVCEYEYIMMNPIETENTDAEKFSMTSLEFQYKDFLKDEVSVYGIEPDSRYVSADVSYGMTAVSSTIAKKYGIEVGDEITLDDPYNRDKSFTFTVDSVYDYDISLAVFISRDTFNDIFDKSSDDFTGYFSNEKLADISDDDVVMIMTSSDFTKLADQMKKSLGDFMVLFGYFGIIMFILIMYILSKQIIERNFLSISMCKILGFKNGEIGGLYILATSVVVVIGLLAAVPLTDMILKVAFDQFLYKYITGYFPCIIRPESYVKMAVMGIASYAVVAGLQMFKINRISKSEALKDRE